MNMQNLREDFLKKGYVVIKNYFNSDQINDLRNYSLQKINEKNEIFEYDFIKKYFFSPDFFNIFKKILNYKKLLYFSDSSINIHKTLEAVPRGFHVDARNDDYDFNKEYPIARLGVYLQNVSDYSGGLKVKPGSHNYYCVTNYKQSIKTFVNEKILKKNKNFKIKFFHKNEQPNLQSGDLIIWNLRLHHSGASYRYKFNRNISLAPYIDKLVPKFLKLPPEFPNNRGAIFIAFANGDLSDNYNIKNYIKKRSNDIKKFSNFEKLRKEFLEQNILMND